MVNEAYFNDVRTYGAMVRVESAECQGQVTVKARLPESVTLYNMRSSCVVLMTSRGVPLRVIQQILGHRSIRTTAAVYTEVYSDVVRSEMDWSLWSYTETKTVYVDYSGKLQNAQIDNVED